ncbi:S9 family peptidase [Parasphingopyxis lamellibrachiae]|nr:prolyl oligopeptidase family serine peptidase [Parasphingopyxis lamellibrachiae]
MTAVDLVEMQRLAAPLLSSDGQILSYRLSEADWQENEIRRTVALRNLTTGEAIDLSGLAIADLLERQIHWQPNHSAFLAIGERDADGEEEETGESEIEHDQAYLIDPATGSIERLTNHHDDIGDPIWARDGLSFYFRSDAEPEPHTDWIIEPFDTARPDALYRQALGTDQATPLVDDGGYLSGYALSRDGSHILYRRRESGGSDDAALNELWLLTIETGATTRLTANDYGESRAQLSPDNRRFAFIATVNADGAPYYEDNLFVQQVGEPQPHLLFPDVPVEVLDFAWTRAGDALWVLGNIGLRTELFRYDFERRQLERITRGDQAIDDWRYDPELDRHIAIVRTQENPGEIYEINVADGALRALTDHYADWPQRFRLPRQEAVRWRGGDGQEIEGLLAYPVGYEPGERFPLVTITHGGPRSSSQFGSWNVSRYVPVLAGQGYGVLLPNHRGGTGYGDAFMRDMVGNYFRNAHLDVLAGIDALIARDLADPDQLIKMGWSAGGHMTSKLITVTDRFAAASSGAGVADWVSLYGESDRRRGRTPWFGGTPWEENAPYQSFREQSPLADAWNVRTPTLFFSGGDDERVPPTQSILMHRAVRAAGAPTELYIADGEPHNYREPRNQLFKINRELEWYALHLGRPAYDPVLPILPEAEDAVDEEEEEAQESEEGAAPEEPEPADTQLEEAGAR